MRNRITAILSLIPGVIFALAGFAAAASPPAGPVKPAGERAAVADFTLPGGLRCLALPDSGCTGVHLRVMVRTGAALDPPDRSGLAAVSIELLENALSAGGQAAGSCVQPMEVAVSAGCDATSVWVAASFPAASLERMLPAFLRRLQEPALSPDALEAIKNRRRAGIMLAAGDPESSADREFRAIVYGHGNPYARTADERGLAGITLEEATEFLDRNFRADTMILGIWGDFSLEKARSLLAESAAGWRQSDAVHPVFPAVAAPPVASVNQLVLPAAGCTLLKAGHVGIRLDHPEWLQLQLMAIILNHRLAASPLFPCRGAAAGLSMPAGCALETPALYPGLFTITAEVDPSSVVPAVTAIRGEIQRIRETPVSGKEIHAARLECVQNFPLPSGAGGGLLSQKLMLAFYGLPLDFVASGKARLVEITPAEIQRVANAFLRPGQLTILVAGPAAQPLAGLGPVQEVRPAAALPVPESRIAAPTFPPPSPASLVRGKMILDRVPEAMALGNRLEGLTGIRLLQAVERLEKPAPPQPAIVETWVFLPDRLRESIRLGDWENSLCLDGRAGWRQSVAEVRPLDLDELDDLRGRLARQPLVFLANSQVEGFRVQRLDPAEIGGKQVESLLIHQGGCPDYQVLVDPENGRLAAIRWYGRRETRTGMYLEVFAPAAEFGGIKYPAGSEIFFDGELFSRTTVKLLEINPALDESLFRQPDSR